MKLPVRWSAHLVKAADKKRFKEQVAGSREVLERLLQMIQKDLDDSIKETSSKTTFENPNWSEYQAYLLGKQAYINQLKALMPRYED